MKKTILATLSAAALLATAPMAQADSNFKSGFKVGGGVGYKRHQVKNITSIDKTNPNILNESFSKTATDDTAAFQLHTGYDFIINRFLAAIEFDYRYSPSEVKMKFNTTQPTFVSGEAPFEVHQTHPHDFGLSGRLGGLVTENFALYVIANVRLGQFKHKFLNKKPSVQALASQTKTKYLWGAGGGIGARLALPKGFSCALETTYDVYQRIKLDREDVNLTGFGTIANVNTRSKKPHIFIAMLKVSKTF